MATPSSSATSASPPTAYISASALPTPPDAPLSPSDSLERETRKKAVQKFLARAEVSMVTRALRARLSYASYKATHNVPHVPLRDLEAQTQGVAPAFPRPIAAKRKASGSNNYYNNPATQGTASGSGSGTAAGLQRRGTMAPPASVAPSAPRSHYPNVNGSTPGANRSANATQSLYSSILAPPPAKQARTIHNASDPPLPAPQRPTAASPATHSRKGSKGSIRSSTESLRGAERGRVSEKRKGKRAVDKGKQKLVEADTDVDMKAAAALTSLLLHSRPSLTGSVSSPRSSIDGSDAGSAQSYSHFAQSSARMTTAAADAAAPGSLTPPPAQPAAAAHTTPRPPPPAPTDNEAADLMLFLATSPSPARPTTAQDKDARDLAAYRVLGGPNASLRAKGRVLFSGAAGGSSGSVNALMRGGGAEGSFASSISSIGGEMGTRTDAPAAPAASASPALAQAPAPAPADSVPAPAAPVSARAPALLPPASPEPGRRAPGTPLPFNFNDFINVSPSPRAGGALGGARGGLRADVGRRLFEEEQVRHQVQAQAREPGGRVLGAGIDLVPS